MFNNLIYVNKLKNTNTHFHFTIDHILKTIIK